MKKIAVLLTFMFCFKISNGQQDCHVEIKRLYQYLKSNANFPASLVTNHQDCFILSEIFINDSKLDSIVFSGCDNLEVKDIVKRRISGFEFTKGSNFTFKLIVPILFKNADKGDNINMNLGLREMDLQKMLPSNNKYELSMATILPIIYVMHYAPRKTVN